MPAETHQPRPGWSWKRRLVLGAVAAFLSLFLVPAGILALLAWRMGEPAKLREDGCEVPLAKQAKCRRWDQSFQDPYFYAVAWGEPDRALCTALLAERPATDSDGACAWDRAGGWEPRDCAAFGLEPRHRCFTCEWQSDGDAFARLQAYTPDCAEGVLFDTAGVALEAVLAATAAPDGQPPAR